MSVHFRSLRISINQSSSFKNDNNIIRVSLLYSSGCPYQGEICGRNGCILGNGKIYEGIAEMCCSRDVSDGDWYGAGKEDYPCGGSGAGGGEAVGAGDLRTEGVPHALLKSSCISTSYHHVQSIASLH